MNFSELLKKEDLKKCVEFHGHLCPGLAIGYVASNEGLKRLNANRSMDEEIVSVVETDACCVDAVQVLLGSTFGKGNFFYKDYGKIVMTFISRKLEKAVRFSLKPGAVGLDERHRELIEKRENEIASEEEIKEFWDLHHQKASEILEKSPEDLFSITNVEMEMPETAEILPSKPCEKCGEPVMVSKLQAADGLKVCAECRN